MNKVLLWGVIFLVGLNLNCCTSAPKPAAEKFEFYGPHFLSDPRVKYPFVQTRFMGEKLGLKPLTSGVDSFEIRCWMNPEIFNPKKVLILSFEKGKWVMREISYQDRNRFEEYMNLMEKNPVKMHDPDSIKSTILLRHRDWTTFTDSLLKLGLFELEDQFDLPGFFTRISDGETIIIEAATRNKYTIFSYNCPDKYPDKENQKALRLIRYLGVFYECF